MSNAQQQIPGTSRETGTPTPPTSSGRRWALVTVAAAAAIAGATVAWRRLALEAPDTRGIWTHRFATPEGGQMALADLQGRPLLVNFWATWCPPCVQELPLLSQFYNQKKADGWQMIGLAIDQLQPVQRFLERTPVSFPVAMAGTSGVELTKALGNTAGGLPFTVIFDASGQLKHRKLGQLQEADLVAWLG